VKIVVALCAWLALHGTAVAADAPAPGEAAAPATPDGGAPEATPADATTPPAQVPAPDLGPPPSPPQPVPLPEPPPPRAAPPPEEWPIEYVLRPQTIPAGYLHGSLTGVATLLDDTFRDSNGRAYGSSYQAGGTLTFGISDRVEFSTFVPRLLCQSASALSVCSDYARINGSGIGFGYGVVRTRAVQLELSTSVGVAITNPLTLSLGVGARTKLLVFDWFALELALAASRSIDAPLGYQETAFGSAIVDLNFQVTHNLLVWVDLEPNAALDHLGEPRLEPFGGASWTFENAVQLGLSGGVYNVLTRHAWDTSLPGKYVAVTLQFWL
jgi:hypothetical protein